MLSIDLKSSLFKERKFIRVLEEIQYQKLANVECVSTDIETTTGELRLGDKIVSSESFELRRVFRKRSFEYLHRYSKKGKRAIQESFEKIQD